jgi:hypothetical protein
MLVDLGLCTFANVWFSYRPPARRNYAADRQREILEIIVYINRAVRNKEHSF